MSLPDFAHFRMSGSRKNILLFALLSVLVVTAFSPTLNAGFLEWDDDHNVYNNPHLQTLSTENLKWMFFDVGRDTRYKALSWLGWAMIHKSFGLHAPAFHAANVILHALNACLVFLLLLRFARTAGLTEDAHLTKVALVGAAIWAVHPFRVEPVAWITGFPYQLSLFFLLGAYLSYLRLDFQANVFRQRNYWLALFCYFAAMLSYPMPIGGVAILIGLNIFPLKRISLTGWRETFSRSTGRVALELAPLAIISAAMLAVAVYGAHVRLGIFEKPPTLEEYPFFHRALQACYVWCYYLWKPFVPFGLSPVYTTFAPINPVSFKLFASVAAFIGISWYVFINRVRRPEWSGFWLAHLGVLVPVLGINVIGHSQADRYSIIHGILLSMAFVWLAANRRTKDNEIQIQIVGAVVAVFFAALTWNQSAIWENNTTFFTHQVETLPNGGSKAIAQFRLGNVDYRGGDMAAAETKYRRAREIFPPLPLPELPFRHAEVLFLQRRFQEAAEQYNLAVQLKPNAYETWYGLSQSLIALGQLDAAERVCHEALTLHPDTLEFHEDLARIRNIKTGQTQ